MSTLVANLNTSRFFAETVRAEVEYKTLVPANAPVDRPLPLILHLHGAMSSAASLELARPAYEAAWAGGLLPPALVASASTPTAGGFYIDYPLGPAWETLLADELPRHLRARRQLAARAAVLGFSMGGYGALKLALRRPHSFVAVAALCPTVFPAETPDEVPERNRPSVLGALNEAMRSAGYEAASVHSLVRRNREAIAAASLGIYLDCGDADEFHLHDGAVYLHRLMATLDIPHQFCSVTGAGHADAQAAARQSAAIGFVGTALWRTNPEV
jgi:S-formylglutathione hydrolase